FSAARTFSRSVFSRMKPVASLWSYEDASPSMVAIFGSYARTRSQARKTCALPRAGHAHVLSFFFQRDRFLRFFNKFIETRIVAQRIPEWEQFQFAIAKVARAADNAGKLFAGEIFVANPRSDHRQILNHGDALKLDRAPAFAQGVVFPPKSGVDQAKHAQCLSVIWLSLDDFLLLRACSSKSRPRFAFVLHHTSDNTFYEWIIKRNVVV